MTFDWRAQSLDDMSLIQLDVLAREGNVIAASMVREAARRQHERDRPLAHNDQLGWFDGDHT